MFVVIFVLAANIVAGQPISSKPLDPAECGIWRVGIIEDGATTSAETRERVAAGSNDDCTIEDSQSETDVPSERPGTTCKDHHGSHDIVFGGWLRLMRMSIAFGTCMYFQANANGASFSAPWISWGPVCSTEMVPPFDRLEYTDTCDASVTMGDPTFEPVPKPRAWPATPGQTR